MVLIESSCGKKECPPCIVSLCSAAGETFFVMDHGATKTRELACARVCVAEHVESFVRVVGYGSESPGDFRDANNHLLINRTIGRVGLAAFRASTADANVSIDPGARVPTTTPQQSEFLPIDFKRTAV